MDKLEQLKTLYGNVWHLKIPLDDDKTKYVEAYLKKPDRTALSASMTVGKSNSLKGKEILLNAAWIEGDEVIKTDDDLFLSACAVLDDMYTIRYAELKKN